MSKYLIISLLIILVAAVFFMSCQSKKLANQEAMSEESSKKTSTTEVNDIDGLENQKVVKPLVEPTSSVKSVETNPKSDTEANKKADIDTNNSNQSLTTSTSGEKEKKTKGGESKSKSPDSADQTKPSKFLKGGDKIVFGSGGGFTGMTTTYAITKEGQLLKQQPDESMIKLHAFKTLDIDPYFEKIEKCNIEEVDCNSPGNMTFFLEQIKDGKSKRLVWGGSKITPPEDVKSLHGELMRLVRDLGNTKTDQPTSDTK